MKKKVFSAKHFALLTASMAVMTFVGCADSDDIKDSSTTDTVILHAVIDSESGTRTEFDSTNRKALWLTTDKVNINGTEYTAQHAGTSTTFTSVTSAASYIAYYPASMYNSATQITLPATQTYSSDPVVNAPMYAYSETTNLTFKNLCGVFRLTLKGSDQVRVRKIILTAVQAISGVSTINTSNPSAPLASVPSGTEGVTLDCSGETGGGVQLSASGVTFNIVMPQCDYENLKITVVNTEGKVQTLSAGDFSVGRSMFELADATVNNFQYPYVDLGLPSHLKWATFNVGATAPEEYGDYFAWGETVGYMGGKTNFDSCFGNYKWGTNYNALTKYITKSKVATPDNKTVLEPADDAATQSWGGSWRMPTHEEWQELVANTDNRWTSYSTASGTVYGYEFTGNGQTLFLPAAGYRVDEEFNDTEYNLYWSSSLDNNTNFTAYGVSFDSSGIDADGGDYRCWGHSVRPVIP